MKTNASTVIAGCIGGKYDLTLCQKESESASQTVVCCKENGCNKQLPSAGTPRFTNGVPGSLLVVSIVLRTLVAEFQIQ